MIVEDFRKVSQKFDSLIWMILIISRSLVDHLMMIHRLLTGVEFNEEYRGKQMIKLTNELENHNGYQFQTGLNVDSVPFNPIGNCSPGGIYFCLLDELSRWLSYGDNVMYYARFVTIPDDALVWTEGDKFKADQMSLSDRVLIGDLEVWWNNDYNLRACQRNPRAFRYVKEKTEEFWLSIIISDGGYSLQFVDESFQTEKICLAAVQQFGRALRYVKDSRQTETICLAAVRQNGLALQYVKESLRTRKVCLAAVEANFHALQYVDVGDQTKEICLAAFIDGCPPYSHYFKDPEGFNKQSAWEEYVAREKNLFIIC